MLNIIQFGDIELATENYFYADLDDEDLNGDRSAFDMMKKSIIDYRMLGVDGRESMALTEISNFIDKVGNINNAAYGGDGFDELEYGTVDNGPALDALMQLEHSRIVQRSLNSEAANNTISTLLKYLQYALAGLAVIVTVLVALCFSLLKSIGQRKKTIAVLNDSTNLINGILSNISDGIITIDERGIIETFNSAAEKIFVYEAAEVIGKNIEMLIPFCHLGQHDGYLNHYRDAGVAR